MQTTWLSSSHSVTLVKGKQDMSSFYVVSFGMHFVYIWSQGCVTFLTLTLFQELRCSQICEFPRDFKMSTSSFYHFFFVYSLDYYKQECLLTLGKVRRLPALPCSSPGPLLLPSHWGWMAFLLSPLNWENSILCSSQAGWLVLQLGKADGYRVVGIKELFLVAKLGCKEKILKFCFQPPLACSLPNFPKIWQKRWASQQDSKAEVLQLLPYLLQM